MKTRVHRASATRRYGRMSGTPHNEPRNKEDARTRSPHHDASERLQANLTTTPRATKTTNTLARQRGEATAKPKALAPPTWTNQNYARRFPKLGALQSLHRAGGELKRNHEEIRKSPCNKHMFVDAFNPSQTWTARDTSMPCRDKQWAVTNKRTGACKDLRVNAVWENADWGEHFVQDTLRGVTNVDATCKEDPPYQQDKNITA